MCYQDAAQICVVMTEHLESVEKYRAQAEAAFARACRLSNLGRVSEAEIFLNKAVTYLNLAFGYECAAVGLMHTLEECF